MRYRKDDTAPTRSERKRVMQSAMRIHVENAMPRSHEYIEAIKILRSNIEFSETDVQVMMITSTVEGEGKTTTALELSKAYGQMGKRVLFVDADMRKPLTLGVAGNQPGLSDFLSGRAEEDEIIFRTNIVNVDMIYSGTPVQNPTELLEKRAFVKLITFARESYDYVILDTPGMLNLVDAMIVSKCCDGIVFVVQSGLVSHKLVRKAVDRLDRSRSKILGIVINRSSAAVGF